MLERPVLVGDDKAIPGLMFPAGALSVVQYWILCTELSKLLEEAISRPISQWQITNILDVRRIHFHERSVFQENACNPLRYIGRELAIRIEFFALSRVPHQRCRSRFQSRKEAFFVERKQGFNATEDNFPFRCGDDSFSAGTNTTDEVDRGSTGLHVNVDEFLQSFDISPFSPSGALALL